MDGSLLSSRRGPSTSLPSFSAPPPPHFPPIPLKASTTLSPRESPLSFFFLGLSSWGVPRRSFLPRFHLETGAKVFFLSPSYTSLSGHWSSPSRGLRSRAFPSRATSFSPVISFCVPFLELYPSFVRHFLPCSFLVLECVLVRSRRSSRKLDQPFSRRSGVFSISYFFPAFYVPVSVPLVERDFSPWTEISSTPAFPSLVQPD